MAYTARLAAALSGATTSQLRHWRHTPGIYSFQDVLALRTSIYLERTGQTHADIADVIEPFPVRANVVVPHLLRPRPHLEVDPEVQGGIPVIANTRVPYDAVSSLIPDVPPEKISDYYPSVSAAAAADALDFARYVEGETDGRRSQTHPNCPT